MTGSRVRKMSLVVAKINYLPDLFMSKEDQLMDVVTMKVITECKLYDYFWVFGDIKRKKLGGRPVIAGRLGKYHTSQRETIYDRGKLAFVEDVVISEEAKYSNFVIDVDRMAIAFEDRSPGIKYRTFMTAFKRYSKKTLELEPLAEAAELNAAIREFTTVTKADLYVFKPNPHAKPEYERIIRILEEARAEKGSISLETGKEKGLQVSGSIVENGIQMANSGYGHFTLEGVKRKKSIKMDSRSKVLKRLLEIVDSPEEIIPSFIDIIDAVLRDHGHSRD